MHIVTGAREEHNSAIRLAFKTTNNKTEYEALLAKLGVAESLGADKMEVGVNSQVVFNLGRGVSPQRARS